MPHDFSKPRRSGDSPSRKRPPAPEGGGFRASASGGKTRPPARSDSAKERPSRSGERRAERNAAGFRSDERRPERNAAGFRSDERKAQPGDKRRPASAARSSAQQAEQRQGGKAAATPQQAAERFPQAEFARREGELEGKPAHMVVNRSLKGYPFRKDFPWCLRLAVAYRSDPQSGLPLPREERVLEAFEQNLFGLLKKSVNGHYVGNTSWGGSREFVFYVDEGGDAEGPLNTFADAQNRALEYHIEEDARWEQAAHYFDYRD